VRHKRILYVVSLAAHTFASYVASSLIVNGRRVVVQKRRSFAVYVGEQPVKPG
jgi:hypothetical protein